MSNNPEIQAENTIRDEIFDLLVLMASVVVALLLSEQRLVARDEGFYTYAVQLVLHGFSPYRDFFYPQMPFLPYCYALLISFLDLSWEGMRFVTGCFTGGILFLTYRVIRFETSRSWALLGLLLVLHCHLTVACFSVVQTYSLSTFLCLLSFALFINRSCSFVGGISAGIAMGATVSTRLFFAPVSLLPLILLLSTKLRRKTIGYCIGGIIVVIPLLILMSCDYDSFWYNNLGYHFARSSKDFSSELSHKWRVFEVLFSLGRPSQKFDGFQTPIIFIGMFLSFIIGWFLSWRAFGSALFGVVIFGVSFLPSPTYVQYFCSVVPFAVIASILTFSRLLDDQSSIVRYIAITALVALSVVYSWHVPADFLRYTKTGDGVIGVGGPKGAIDWNIPRLREVTTRVQELTRAEDQVLTFWPGYLVGTERFTISGTENHFGIRAASKLTEKERRRYLLLNEDEIIRKIKNRELDLIVGFKRSIRGKFRRAIVDAEYVEEESVGNVLFYRKREQH